MIENIFFQNDLISIIIKKDFVADGITFFTPDDFSQQLSYMHHATGKVIQAHIHNHLPRQVFFTQEVLIIKKGILKVDFYSNDKIFIESRILETGDVILLASGGHGFEVLEEVEMIEVKQGPYLGEQDKLRF